MAYGNGFPVTYPQMFPQFQPGFQQNFQQASPQAMTPPTIHADIIQINNEQEAWNYPAGQIMMTRDESAMEHIDKMAHALKSLATYEAMQGYSEMSGYRGDSYARGRSRMTGRYISRDDGQGYNSQDPDGYGRDGYRRY